MTDSLNSRKKFGMSIPSRQANKTPSQCQAQRISGPGSRCQVPKKGIPLPDDLRDFFNRGGKSTAIHKQFDMYFGEGICKGRASYLVRRTSRPSHSLYALQLVQCHQEC